MQPEIFFIVGSPRSGTTLLQSMLMRAPGVTIPPETHFMALAGRPEAARLDTEAGWKALRFGILARHKHEGIETPIEDVEAALDGAERTKAGALRAWLGAIAAHEGARIIGEKSPNHTTNIPELLSMFPGARVVHIVRDPRDVALSQKQVWDRPTVYAAKRWQLDMKIDQRCRALFDNGREPSRYRLVRYEDLVSDPEPMIRSLAGFLGIDYTPEMADPSGREKTGFSAAETHKLQTLEKVTTSRIGRYKGVLSKPEIAVVETICSRLMREHGYEPEIGPCLLGWLTIASQMPRAVLGRRDKRNIVPNMMRRSGVR